VDLSSIYALLRERFGPLRWWPAESSFEVCVGAVLTQGTAWTNVEKALASLRLRGKLSLRALTGEPPARVAPWIRSAGFYRVKAKRLGALLRFLGRHGGRVERLRSLGLARAREELLRVDGIGPETADTILLYGAGLPTFVVDAYTRRVFGRLGFLEGGETYEAVRAMFMSTLPRRVALYNDYHAQIVTLAKVHCRAVPRCDGCPLGTACPRLDVGGVVKFE
jgi:endonuclease-3 related protein